MISFIEGKIEYIFQNRIIINQNGIGFEIYVPQKLVNLLNQNDDVKIYTYMSVKEDNISLFGFNSIDEREIFLKLITVNGVGPKNALQIIDNLGIERLLIAIKKNDYKTIKTVPGIGDKLSKVICIDMTSKIDKLSFEVDNDIIKDNDNLQSIKYEVLSALLQLGYQKRVAEDMIKNVNINDISHDITSEKYLELALKNI